MSDKKKCRTDVCSLGIGWYTLLVKANAWCRRFHLFFGVFRCVWRRLHVPSWWSPNEDMVFLRQRLRRIRCDFSVGLLRDHPKSYNCWFCSRTKAVAKGFKIPATALIYRALHHKIICLRFFNTFGSFTPVRLSTLLTHENRVLTSTEEWQLAIRFVRPGRKCSLNFRHILSKPLTLVTS